MVGGDDESCADAQTAPPLDEYGFPVDPGLLVPCDELVADEPEVDVTRPSPALSDPDPASGSKADDEELADAFSTWRGTTAASLVDEYFQLLALRAAACDPAWFDEPYDGDLRVADGTAWRAAAHTAMASVPEPRARALLYEAQDAFWKAGSDCDLSIETWLTATEPGLDALEAAGAILEGLL